MKFINGIVFVFLSLMTLLCLVLFTIKVFTGDVVAIGLTIFTGIVVVLYFLFALVERVLNKLKNRRMKL